MNQVKSSWLDLQVVQNSVAKRLAEVEAKSLHISCFNLFALVTFFFNKPISKL